MAHVQQVDPECYEPLWQTQHEPLRIQKMKWDGNRFEKKNQNIFLFPRTELSCGSSSPPREGLCPQQLREWPEVPYSLLHRTHCPTVGHCRCDSFTSSLFEIKIYLPVVYLCQFVDPWSQEWTGVICIPNAHPTHLLGFGGEPAERTKNQRALRVEERGGDCTCPRAWDSPPRQGVRTAEVGIEKGSSPILPSRIGEIHQGSCSLKTSHIRNLALDQILLMFISPGPTDDRCTVCGWRWQFGPSLQSWKDE